MKKLAGFLAVLMLLAGSSLYAQSSPVAAGNLELGIGKLISYDRLWQKEGDPVHIYAIGTFGNGYRSSMAENIGMMFPTPVFSVAYFAVDGLAFGVQACYSQIKVEDMTLNQAYIAPEVKFYINLNENMLLDAHGSFGYSYTKIKDGDKLARLNYTLGAGLNFLVTDNFAAVLGVDYIYYADTYENDTKQKDSYFNDINLSLGLKTFI